MVDTNTTITTDVTFQENCEYQSSNAIKELPIPRQYVQITLNISNVTADLPENYTIRHQNNYMINNQPKNYYTDILQCTATVTLPKTNPNEIGVPIQAGRIEFYYQPENSSVRKLLNKPTSTSQTCLLNQQGKAAIKIQPKTSGTIIAVYVDDNDNYIQENEATENIELYRMPVTINFTDVPPYIAHVEDEVTLEVEVKDINQQPLNYGLVTFMHYIIKQEDINNPNKRVETMIGNPILVQDGKAKISYIPVQTDNYNFDNGIDEPYDLESESLQAYDVERYIENIRAVYNYDSDDYYGLQWKYYSQKATWTSIAIARRNSLTIGIDNADLDINLAYNVFESETSDVVVKGFLHDKNNNNINLNNNDEENIIYHIKGTHSHPLSMPQYNTLQSYHYTDYQIDITDIQHITQNGTTAYAIRLPHLLPGTYTITADTEDIEFAHNPNNKEHIDSDDIHNDIYLEKIDNSNELLLTVHYDDSLCDINFDSTSILVNQDFNITGTINVTDNQLKDLLNNQTCRFYINELQKQYNGTIKLRDNTLHIESDTINIKTSGAYTISVTIPNGVYSTNYNDNTYHNENIDFYIPLQNHTTNIIVNEHINVELNATFKNGNNAPCQTGYSIIGHDITNEVHLSLAYKLKYSNDEPTIINSNIILTKDYNSNYGDIPELLNGGEYQLIASTPHQTFTSDFTIQAATLQQNIANNQVEMGLNKTIGIYLTNNSDITDIDISKISIYTQKANTTYDKNQAHQVNIQSYNFINAQTLYITAFTYTYDIGEYWISVSYAGDENFTRIDCPPDKFSTYLHTPKAEITRFNNSYTIDIFYYNNNGDKQRTQQVLLLPIVFMNNNQVIKDNCLLITNEYGGVDLITDGDITRESWWSTWSAIKIIFDPYNAELINTIENDFTDLNQYNFVFDKELIVNVNKGDHIIGQLHSHDNKYIYDTYQPYELTIQRPSD